MAAEHSRRTSRTGLHLVAQTAPSSPLGASHSTEDDLAAQLDASLTRLTEDATLLDEVSFSKRSAALDLLEFEIIEGLRALMRHSDPGAERLEGPGGSHNNGPLGAILDRANAYQKRLEEVDRILFARLRGEIREGLRGTHLVDVLSRYVDFPPSGDQRTGYDDLDDFLAGLLLPPPAPEAARPLEAGMVFYQPTPARVILELVEVSGLTEARCFVDVGSGLGLVSIVVHLLTGARSIGIEIDPSYIRYARQNALDLGLAGSVEFREGDARQSDYSDGDVIFLYTPFTGVMLDDALARLRQQTSEREVRFFSYGPCTATVARQSWLKATGPVGSPERLATFVTSGP